MVEKRQRLSYICSTHLIEERHQGWHSSQEIGSKYLNNDHVIVLTQTHHYIHRFPNSIVLKIETQQEVHEQWLVAIKCLEQMQGNLLVHMYVFSLMFVLSSLPCFCSFHSSVPTCKCFHRKFYTLDNFVKKSKNCEHSKQSQWDR